MNWSALVIILTVSTVSTFVFGLLVQMFSLIGRRGGPPACILVTGVLALIPAIAGVSMQIPALVSSSPAGVLYHYMTQTTPPGDLTFFYLIYAVLGSLIAIWLLRYSRNYAREVDRKLKKMGVTRDAVEANSAWHAVG